jgi:hypothetical protein
MFGFVWWTPEKKQRLEEGKKGVALLLLRLLQRCGFGGWSNESNCIHSNEESEEMDK